MNFSSFENVEQVLEKYPLKMHKAKFLPKVEISLPTWFMENLDFILTMQSANESEMFFREYLLSPFMQYVWQQHPHLKLWVNKPLRYGDELYGEPDYFISYRDEGKVNRLITKPLLAVAEAKKQDFAKGWGQCLAEMIACQKLNADDTIVIYGIVSTGMVWEFAKLSNDTFTQDPFSYSIVNPSQVMGVLNFVFAECQKQAVASHKL